MAESGSARAAAGNDAAGDVVDAIALLWRDAAHSAQRMMRLDYSLNNALHNADLWISTSTALAARLGAIWWRSDDEVQARPQVWRTTMRVREGLTDRPLRLRAGTFRAIGHGSREALDPRQIRLEPSVLEAGRDTFEVIVSYPQDTGEPVIYEGEIVDEATGTPVTDLVRPNNLDAGPER